MECFSRFVSLSHLGHQQPFSSQTMTVIGLSQAQLIFTTSPLLPSHFYPIKRKFLCVKYRASEPSCVAALFQAVAETLGTTLWKISM